MLRRIFLTFLMLFAFACLLHAVVPETLDVGIYQDQKITGVVMIPAAGIYRLYDSQNNVICELSLHESLLVEPLGDHLSLSWGDTTVYVRGEVMLKGLRWENFFIVRPEGIPYRIYDDDLIIRPGFGQLTLVNRVAIEKYIAGVVQSESGWNRHPAFYEVQAIIARTYALRNQRNNGHHGFDLCDGVHCQAYYGRTAYEHIIAAVDLTRGDVVVDADNRLINAVYHANCGGETVNSEHVWQQAESYLKGVVDPHCVGQPGYAWEASLTQDQLFRFLESNYGLVPNATQRQQILTFTQHNRLHTLRPFQQVSLRFIRTAFNFRSTFFSFSPFNEKIFVQGRGYGHGVGLCQEGAMEMAKKGYDRGEIIDFYYRNVRLLNLD